MAKIAKMPGLKIIDGFKGTLDFYVWKGIACVRRWPRSPGHRRAPAVEAQWAAFAWAASNWNSLTPVVQDAYRAMAAGTHMSGRDIFTKSFITTKNISLAEL
ncbi:hypothetical protein ES703_45981 [subsurface metagenome]